MMMKTTIFIDKTYTYALIGASQNTEKYGHKVFVDLTEAGYTVLPVNPKGGMLCGTHIYTALGDILEQVDVAIFVVPPTVTESLLPEIEERQIKKVWFQPGSESDVAMTFCKNHGIAFIAHACMMLERPQHKESV